MLKVFIILIVAGKVARTEDTLELTDEEYYQLPALFEVQDYEKCLSQSENVFCVGSFELSAAEPSRIYNILKEFSANKREHFNHTRLHRAVCLGPKYNCPVKDDLVQSFEECIDKSMFEEYGLRAHILLFNYCRRPGEKFEIDGVVIAFCTYLTIVLVLNIVGTVYHCRFKAINTKGNRWLMAFSLVDNWKRLTSASETGDSRFRNFTCFNGIKVLSTIVLFSLHALIVIYLSFPTNSRIIDQLSETPIAKYVSYHGNVMIQSFVLVTSFLTAYKMLAFSEKYAMKLSLLPKLIIDRVVRIQPMHLTSVGLAATIFVHLNDGPIWYKYAGSEITRCRDLWWHHVFFVHNTRHWAHCVPQSWYLALDFQLYVACCFIMLWIISRGLDPEYVLKRLLAASLLMLFAIVYFFELLPQLLTVTPDNILNLFADESSQIYLYQSAWGNLPAAILGLLLASTYYRMEREKIDLTKSKVFVFMNRWSPLMLLMWTLSIYLFTDIESRLAVSLYATAEKIGFAAILSIAVVGCLYKMKSPVATVLCWPGWLTLSRLSLAALLFHVMVNEYITFSRIHNTALRTQAVADTVAVSVITYIVALPLALMVEYPAVQLYKAIIYPTAEHSTRNVASTKKKRT